MNSIINHEIITSIKKILEKGDYILGKEVYNFEKELANFLGIKYAIGFNTGTDALLYSLKALDIKSNDEIITTPFSFSATADVIVMAGARPVFADIDLQSYNINPSEIEKKITKKTKAIIVVHLYGQPANMTEIMRVAKKYNLKVIEDNAQALGAKYNEKYTGTLGDIGCLSFFPTKHLGACGDGGAAITNSKKIAKKLKLMRVHGALKMYYDYPIIGGSSRLHTLQATILKVKLKYLNYFLKQRIKNANLYYFGLNKSSGKIILPRILKKSFHSFCSFTIRVLKYRGELYSLLKNKGLPVYIHYPVPIHLFSSYKFLNYKIGDFPQAERISKEVISLPVNPEIDKKTVNKIIDIINNFKK